MNITHPQLVAALAKSGEAIINDLTPLNMHLLHMAVGVSGEVGELIGARELPNIVEEHGDVEFYMEGLCASLNIAGDRDFASAPGETLALWAIERQLAIAAADLLDKIKKVAIYAKLLDPMQRSVISFAVARLDMWLCAHRIRTGVDREEALQANIDKLRVRYDGLQYSNDAAQRRVDKPEGE